MKSVVQDNRLIIGMNAVIFCVLILAIVGEVQSFMGSLGKARNVRGSTIVMDGKTRDLRDRIKSIKQTRRITEAMRLVAAARVRRAQDAVLKSRPLIAQLQLVRAFRFSFSNLLCY